MVVLVGKGIVPLVDGGDELTLNVGSVPLMVGGFEDDKLLGEVVGSSSVIVPDGTSLVGPSSLNVPGAPGVGSPDAISCAGAAFTAANKMAVVKMVDNRMFLNNIKRS